MAEKKQKKAAKEAAVPPAVRELQQRKRMETLCTMLAWGNEKFRKKLLADPKAALEEGLKLKLPAGMKITIVEEKPNEICVSLPPKPAEGELSDDQLESVAGGGRNAVENWFEDQYDAARSVFQRDTWDQIGGAFRQGWDDSWGRWLSGW